MRHLARFYVLLTALSFIPADAVASDLVRELKWEDLASAGAQNQSVQPKVLGPHSEVASGRWQQEADASAPVVAELNGKRVKIGGYVIPLEYKSATLHEFLLVPYFGACIHVPAPPANQLIFVKSEQGFELYVNDAINVVGTLKTDLTVTELANVGYTLNADSFELIKQ